MTYLGADQKERSITQIRRAHPNVSIPSGADLSHLGYMQIEPTARPTCAENERPVRSIAQDSGGQWRESWSIETIPIEEWRVSASISRLQARLQLLDAGLWAGVMAWAAAADPASAAFFDDAQVWRRNDPTLAAAAAQLGLSESDLDDLFRAAALR